MLFDYTKLCTVENINLHKHLHNLQFYGIICFHIKSKINIFWHQLNEKLFYPFSPSKQSNNPWNKYSPTAKSDKENKSSICVKDTFSPFT